MSIEVPLCGLCKILIGSRVRIVIEMTMNEIYIEVNPEVKDHFKKKLVNFQLCMTSNDLSFPLLWII